MAMLDFFKLFFLYLSMSDSIIVTLTLSFALLSAILFPFLIVLFFPIAGGMKAKLLSNFNDNDMQKPFFIKFKNKKYVSILFYIKAKIFFNFYSTYILQKNEPTNT